MYGDIVTAVSVSEVDDRYLVTAGWLAATLAALVVVGIVLQRMGREHPLLRTTLRRIRRPGIVLALAVVLRACVPLLGRMEQAITYIATALVVLAAAWLVATAVLAVEDMVLRRYRIDVADNLRSRRAQTQVSLVRRVTVAVIGVLAAGAVLMSFPAVRTVGASLLASAGIAGLVAGLAAQSTLANVFAGLNLAFGNALRLDDVLVVEGEWGRVEEITLSYVVLRIWDDRRLILPTSYFTSTPFQNWTRSSSSVIGTVDLDVDWTLPVEELREHAQRVVSDSPLWDGRAYNLQITDATGGQVRARVMVSAADSPTLWDLRCHVREHVVTWLQQRHPSALPRTRAELHDPRRGAVEPS